MTDKITAEVQAQTATQAPARKIHVGGLRRHRFSMRRKPFPGVVITYGDCPRPLSRRKLKSVAPKSLLRNAGWR